MERMKQAGPHGYRDGTVHGLCKHLSDRLSPARAFTVSARMIPLPFTSTSPLTVSRETSLQGRKRNPGR